MLYILHRQRCISVALLYHLLSHIFFGDPCPFKLTKHAVAVLGITHHHNFQCAIVMVCGYMYHTRGYMVIINALEKTSIAHCLSPGVFSLLDGPSIVCRYSLSYQHSTSTFWCNYACTVSGVLFPCQHILIPRQTFVFVTQCVVIH